MVGVAAESAEDSSAALLRALNEHYLVSRECTPGMLNIVDLDSCCRVNVGILKGDEYAQAAFARRTRQRFFNDGETDAFVMSPEDSVLSNLQLQWQSHSGSDFSAALEVYEVQEPDLDQAYLDEWAAPLGVSDLLARVRREAVRPEPPPL
jgi:hypothetical protein